jgi:cytidyltransferase-like protein
MDQNKGKIGFTAGNFDLLHPGYIYTFETAKEHCDYFMVFLQRDPSETRYTKYKPVIPLYERYKTLMAIQYVDEVITYQTEEDLIKLGFERTDVSKDESGDVAFHYYTYDFGLSRSISLISLLTNIHLHLYWLELLSLCFC